MKKFMLAAMGFALFLSGCGDMTRHSFWSGLFSDSDSGRSSASTSGSSGTAKSPQHIKPVRYSDLPGWREDDHRYALRAFRNTCQARLQYSGAVVPDRQLLEEKCGMLPRESASRDEVRQWFEIHFQPYKVHNESGNSKGLFTGYYSPIIPACRNRTTQCNEPLMAPPADGQNFKGIERREIVSKQIGRPLYWANIVDVQNIQIQGSGTIRLEDGSLVKLNFAGVNDMPFKSIGGQLQERGIRPSGGFGADAVWTHLRQNPALAQEVINNNQRYVYFVEAQAHDVIGTIGTPLSKIRSIAIDNTIYTLGLPVYVDTSLSDGRKFQRLMVAQDTGGAIRGWVRVDIFFGVGDEAFEVAQGQYAQGEKYILMPKK
ncbi:MAG: MltA domain-containing protein [Alphaproteobacteria bacterium]|nr:MltA domain-containing protein [Alphaproteobacteria bacterium]